MSDPRQQLGEWDVVAGDPLSITINITSGGTGVNLTTYGTTWTADLRTDPTSSTSVPFTVDASAASTGTLVLSLTGTQTSTMATSLTCTPAPTSWQFDLQASGGTVSPQTPFQGMVIAYPPYTHA